MSADNSLQRQTCHVPADCYNRLRLAYIRAGGLLEVPVKGLSDNVMLIRNSDWQCWNRKLKTLLLSLENFRTDKRDTLHEPVSCTMTIHHSYSRTIIHRLFDGLIQRPATKENPTDRETAQIISIARK